MELTLGNFAEALLWSAGAALAVWFLLLPLRRRSFLGLLATLVLTGAAASTGALLGAIHAMLIPHLHWQTTAALIVLSAAAAGVAALAAGRRLAGDKPPPPPPVAQGAARPGPSAARPPPPA